LLLSNALLFIAPLRFMSHRHSIVAAAAEKVAFDAHYHSIMSCLLVCLSNFSIEHLQVASVSLRIGDETR